MRHVNSSIKLMSLLAAMVLLVGVAGAQANAIDSIDPETIRVPDITRTANKTPRADKAIRTVGPGQAYTTIQAAVDAAAPNDVINVLAGEYYESVEIVTSGLTINGPNAGIDPNTGTRVAEAIIYPTDFFGIYVEGGNVIIDGFTIDGDNPNLTSNVIINGADIDGEYGVYGGNLETDGPITVQYNRVINWGAYGFVGWLGGVALSSGNIIQNNLFDNIEYDETYGGGRSVMPHWSYYASILNNVIMRCSVGIYDENGTLAATTTPVWSGNTIYSKRAGIWYNLQYSAAPSPTITNNDLYVEDSPTGTRWYGVWLTSLGNASATIDPVITDNRIHGAAVTQETSGYHLWNNPTPSGITITGGTVDGVNVGLWVNNWVGYNSDGGDTHMIVDGVDISNVDVAVYIQDDAQNTNGSVISADVLAGTTITGAAIDVKVEGTDVAFNVDSSLAPVAWAVSGGSIQDMIDAAYAGDSILVAAGTYPERLVVNKSLTINGEDEATVIVDAGAAATGTYGCTVSADDVTITDLTLLGDTALSASRYGFKPSSVADFTLTNVTAREFYRTGVDLLGVTNGVLTDVTSVDNGGHGLALTDCNGVQVSGLTVSGNAWQGVSVATWGRYSPLGTSGIVFGGTNTLTDAFQLEMGDYNNPGVAPAGDAIITYSTNIADGADVTVQAGELAVALHGLQDDAPDQVRIWLAPDLATAALVPAVGGPVGHFTGDDMFIEDLATDGLLHITPGCEIQAAIDFASTGDTIQIAAGTYTENVTVTKHVDIVGAGSGDDDSSNTIITQTSAGAGDPKVGIFQLEASGASAIDPILLRDLRLEPSGMAGISVGRFTEATGQLVEYLALDNVHVIGTNINPSTEQERGLYVDLTSTLRYLDVVDSAFDNLTYGWYTQKQVSADASTVEYVTVEGTSFNHNNHKGVYVEKLSEATFTACTADQNGFDSAALPSYFRAWSAGIDVNLKAGTYQNVSFIDCVVTDNATDEAKEGTGMTIKARDDASSYNTYPATLDGVLISGGQYVANERGIRIGEPGKDNATPINVVITGAEIRDNVQNYSGNDGTMYGGVINATVATAPPVDARNNWWGDATGPFHPTLNSGGLGNAASDNVLFDPWFGGGSASVGVSNAIINCDGSTTVTVSLTVDDYTADVFGVNVVMNATSELDWNTPVSLAPFGTTTQFFQADQGGGSYLINLTTTGNPTQPIVDAGTYPLFQVTFDAAAEGDADITFPTFTMRDPNNAPIPVIATGATITVDCTSPVAVTDITAIPAHNKVNVSWTHDGSDVDHFEVYRAVWHNGTAGTSAYPEYDDLTTDVIPARPANRAAAAAPGSIWELVDGNVPVGTTAIVDDSMTGGRGVYYYEVYAIDLVANASVNAAANDRSTNYWLGDFGGDGRVTPADDIDPLGDAFGTEHGDAAYDNIIDVGPTDDWSSYGIPLTDSKIDFEDLMITALNFGVVTPGTKSDVTISDSVHLAWVQYSETRWALRLLDGQGLQGVRVRASLPEGGAITVSGGDLLDSQSTAHFLRAIGDDVDVNLALLGTGASFTGEGDLFVIDANVALAAEQLTIDARDLENGGMTVELAQLTDVDLPEIFSLGSNFPNPFNPATTIRFALPENQPVRLTIYGIDGRLVTTLVNGDFPAGNHEVTWHGRDTAGRMVASGTYMYRIDAGPYSAVRKMTLMK